MPEARNGHRRASDLGIGNSVVALGAFLAGVAIVAPCYAQNAGQNTGQNRGQNTGGGKNNEWSRYARMGAGPAFVADLDQTLAFDPRSDQVRDGGAGNLPTRRVTSFGQAISPVAALGFTYPDGSRTELEYRYIEPPIDGVVEAIGAGPATSIAPIEGVSGHFIMSNAYLDLLHAGPVEVFIGAGVGGAFLTNGFDERDSAFAYQGRVGALIDLGGTAGLQAEYVYLRTRDVVFGPDAPGRGSVTPRARASGDPFVMSTVSLSLVIGF